MAVMIFMLSSGVSMLITGFTVTGIRFLEGAEGNLRCCRLVARLIMSIIAWRRPCLPRQDTDAAGAADKPADSCGPTAADVLYQAAKSDEIKHRGNARRHGLAPVCTSPMVASLIPHRRSNSAGPR
jgi:hypothetical protein